MQSENQMPYYYISKVQSITNAQGITITRNHSKHNEVIFIDQRLIKLSMCLVWRRRELSLVELSLIELILIKSELI
jgi:hypothetical protein